MKNETLKALHTPKPKEGIPVSSDYSFPSKKAIERFAMLRHLETEGANTVKFIIHGYASEEETTSFFLSLDLVPLHAPQLKPIWQTLKDTLDLKRALQPGNSESTVKSFLIASGLLLASIKQLSAREARYQKDRLTDKAAIETRLLPVLELQEAIRQSIQPPLIEEVREAVDRFKDVYQKAATVPAKGRTEILGNLTLINALLRAKNNPIYTYYIKKTGEKGKDWVNRMTRDGSIKTTLGNEQTAAELLFTGELDGMDSLIRSLVCFCIIGSDLPKEEAITYFLKHPEVQEIFWRDFSENGWRGTDTINLFLQDEETLLKILDTTLKAEYLKSISQEMMREFLLKFIGAIAMFKDKYPNHPNSHNLSVFARGASEVKNHMMSILLDILDDRIPGFIYLDKENRIRFKTPQKHQSGDSFLKEVALIVKNSNGIIYLPRAEADGGKEEPTPVSQNGHRKEEALPKEYPPREHPLDSVTGETKLIPLWGEVMIPKPADRQLIWDLLNQRLAQTHRNLTPQKALSILTAENTVTRHGNDAFLIIPELLPISTPVGMLKDLGIISIEQRENQVTIIIDGRRINDNANSLRFMLNTQLDETNDPTPLALLLKTASLLGRRSFTEQTLSKEEVSEIRSRLKTWNLKAKTEHLPQVTFDENPKARTINGPRVLTLIGKKPAILNILP